MGAGRRSRDAEVPTASSSGLSSHAPRRHPAMTGIDVSPVHGRHCICDRCAPRTDAR